MSTLVAERCLLHPGREAAVRCMECRRYFCRECVTEHSGRMLCAHCVPQAQNTKQRGPSILLWSLSFAVVFLFAWMVFYYLGMGFARIPSSFHGGAP